MKVWQIIFRDGGWDWSVEQLIGIYSSEERANDALQALYEKAEEFTKKMNIREEEKFENFRKIRKDMGMPLSRKEVFEQISVERYFSLDNYRISSIELDKEIKVESDDYSFEVIGAE